MKGIAIGLGVNIYMQGYADKQHKGNFKASHGGCYFCLPKSKDFFDRVVLNSVVRIANLGGRLL